MKSNRTPLRKTSRSATARPLSWARRMRRWLRRDAFENRYLATATDHADLERRMRDLERASLGPALVTLNH